MIHPAERYIRLRIWQGLDEATLLHELVSHLRIPGVASSKKGKFAANVSTILSTCRAHRTLKIVKGSKAQRKATKVPAGLPAWVEDQNPAHLTDDDYLIRFGLDNYQGTTARTVKFQNAIILWQHDVARTLMRGLIAADMDDGEICETIKSQLPNLKCVGKKPPRPVDITSVRQLFWDLSGLNAAHRLAFVGGLGLATVEASAVTQGSQEFMWRLGRGTIKLTDLDRFRDARDVAHARIRQMRFRPETFDHRALMTAYQVLENCVAKVAELESELMAGAEDELDKMRLQEAEDFQYLGDILRDVDYSSDLELVERVHQYGGLEASKRKELEAQIASGQLLDYAVRMEMSDWLDDRLGVESEEDKFGPDLGTTKGPEPEVVYEDDIEDELQEEELDSEALESLSLMSMLG